MKLILRSSKKSIGLSVFSVLLVVCVLIVPLQTRAQVKASEYQPKDLSELIAYLYGMVASLEAQLAAQQGSSGQSSGTSNQSVISIATLSPTNVRDDAATLRGEVSFGKNSYVYVYFDYGTKSTFGKRTSRVRTANSGRVKSISARLVDLQVDRKYYYRAVMELPDGRIVRGATKTFYTDDDFDSDDESDDEEDRGNYISLKDDEYKTNEPFEVRVKSPSRVELGLAQIGMYKVGAYDRSYLDRYTVTKKDQTFWFRTPNWPGTYEIRLFSDSQYTFVSRSEKFIVK